jgi:hypothetical protein
MMNEPAPPDYGLAQYGIAGTVALIFLSAVIVLFRMYIKHRDGAEAKSVELASEHAKKEGEWERRMVEVRVEFERKHRETVEQFSKELRELYEDSRGHEDQVRKEYAAMMSGLSDDYTRSSGEIVRVLDKFYDRFVSPRARTKRE